MTRDVKSRSGRDRLRKVDAEDQDDGDDPHRGRLAALTRDQLTAFLLAPPPLATPPSPSGVPGASNTGVRPGSTLTPRSGPITITQAGTVLHGLDLTYTGEQSAISVNAPNVTIRNVRVRSNGISLIQVNRAGSLLIGDSELINRPAAGLPNCHNGIAMGKYTARRLEITGC